MKSAKTKHTKLSYILIASLKWLPMLLYLIITRPLHFYTYYFNRPAYFKVCSSWAKFHVFYFGIKLSIRGAELAPKPGRKFLIAANHQSYMDIPIMMSIFPCAFIQRSVPYFPGLSWHFGRMTLVIEKDKPFSIFKAIKYVKKVTVNLGIPTTLFPEGTRSIDGTLGELNIGAAAIAKTLNLPVLPITIYNSRDVFPKGAINTKPGTVLVGIQPMIEEDFIKNHSMEEIIKEIKQRLQEGLDSLAQKRQEMR